MVSKTRKQKRFVPGTPSIRNPAGRPGIGPLRKGELAEFGYVNVASLSERKRHLALGRAVRVYGALSVFRKLNAVYVYTRYTAPVSSAIFKLDRDWIKEYYGF